MELIFDYRTQNTSDSLRQTATNRFLWLISKNREKENDRTGIFAAAVWRAGNARSKSGKIVRVRMRRSAKAVNKNMSSASNKSQQLFEDWQATTRYRKSAIEQLKEADERYNTARDALALSILPQDAETGEKIGLWMRIDRRTERVLQITKTEDGYDLCWRGSREVEN